MASFPLFSRLPPEIRTLIWREALPLASEDAPALFEYKEGCWQPRYLLPSDPEYLHEWGQDNNIDFGFHGHLLNPVQVDIPLYFVCWEARTVALVWIQHHCIETWSYRGRIMFSRWFDKDLDIMYMPDCVDDFLVEPEERPFEPDLLGKTISCGSDNFTKLAMSAEVLRLGPEFIHEMFPLYAVEVLFLIVGSDNQPDWKHPPIDGKLSQRFELEEEPPGRALIWNATTESLELSTGSDVMDDMLNRWMEGYGESFISVLTENNVDTFRMQPTHLKDQKEVSYFRFVD